MTFSERYPLFLQEMQDVVKRSGRNPESVRLVVVTKERDSQEINDAISCGCRDFGESKVQEALKKIQVFPDEMNWHMIGPLQTNKVKKVIGVFSLIHSVDRDEIAKKISDYSLDVDIKTPILLQVNTSGEKSKHGYSSNELLKKIFDLIELKGVEIQGLMTMAPFTRDESLIRKCFRDLFKLQEKLQQEVKGRATLKELSMGMSHDWKIAVEEGATLIRIGTSLFGERDNQAK